MRKIALFLFSLCLIAASANAQIVTPSGGSGGSGGYVSPTVDELGTISNAGTATCNFTNTNACHYTVASGANYTLGNPTNLPTGVVYIGISQAGSGFPVITWGSAFLCYLATSNIWGTCSSDSYYQTPVFSNGTTGTAWLAFWSDGTNLNLLPGGLKPSFNQLKVQGTATFANNAQVNTSGQGFFGLVQGTDGVGGKPQALASYGTCNSGQEGYSGTETNSTAACSAGATATSSGTTHCQIYCNGTNWVQTGL